MSATSRSPATGGSVQNRFLILRALRWFPTGLLIPVLVLLLLDRGLSLAQIGVVFAAQGAMVLLLELPTGGLADAVGRRTTLLIASAFSFAALVLLLFAESLPLLAAVFAMLGVYRALESGPLDSWYVDTAQAINPETNIERGFSLAGTVTGVSIGLGSLASSAIVVMDPFPKVGPLTAPVVAALGFLVVEVAAIALLMTEPPRRGAPASIRSAIGDTRSIVASAVRTVLTSRVLIAIVAVEFLWGFGMTAFETFTPVKLGDVLESADQAAALLGPTNSVAWLVSAVGAASVPLLTKRIRTSTAAATLMVAQGLTVVAIALAYRPWGVVIAYVLTMGIHGAANPVHQGLLHRAVDNPGTRATVASANSMTAQAGGMVGGIALGVLADATNLPTAIVTGAVVIAAAAPLYIRVGRLNGA